VASRSSAQTPAASTTSPRGDSAFARSDWPVMLEAYGGVIKRNPTNGMALFRLGMAQQALKKYDDALGSFARTAELKFQPLGSEYRLARVYALKGDKTRSLEHLTKAEALGLGLGMVVPQPDLDAVRSEPAFTQMLARLEGARYPCRAMPQAHEFDFWIGEWDVNPWQQPGAPPAAAGRNSVHPILEHCIVLEEWTGTGGGNGKSFNFYDTNRLKWRQVWMADGGGSLDYAGEFKDGAMRFEGWTLGPNNQRVLQKLTFTRISADTVRQTFEASNDDGKTWSVPFDGRYVRRK
ncbi:MAG: tetratricopeptide repeat protein, partial [Gemmatimonadales bacterium]